MGHDEVFGTLNPLGREIKRVVLNRNPVEQGPTLQRGNFYKLWGFEG